MSGGMDERDRDYMGKRPFDVITAEAWNGLVELALNLSFRVTEIERRLDEAPAIAPGEG